MTGNEGETAHACYTDIDFVGKTISWLMSQSGSSNLTAAAPTVVH